MDTNKEFTIPQEFIVEFDEWLGKRDWKKRRGLKVSQLVQDKGLQPEIAQSLMVLGKKSWGFEGTIYCFLSILH
jgi:hypothetical protein